MVSTKKIPKFCIFKQKFSKLSILRHHSCDDRPNWWDFGGGGGGEDGKQSQQIFFILVIFVLDTPKEKFSKPSIIHHSIFCQHSALAGQIRGNLSCGISSRGYSGENQFLQQFFAVEKTQYTKIEVQ